MELLSKHNGHFVKAGGNNKAGIRNSYEIWKNKHGEKFVKMEVLKNKETTVTLFDYEFLDKIKNSKTWYVLSNGYVAKSNPFQYLHHLIMNFEGQGRGFQQSSVDHINRDTLDNRKQNLRLASCKEQQLNSKGVIEGTKRTRKKNATKLPENIQELPKYIVYYKEKYGKNDKIRNFFRIEKHPGQLLKEPLLKNKWATSKSMKISIQEKLNQAIKELNILDKKYKKHLSC